MTTIETPLKQAELLRWTLAELVTTDNPTITSELDGNQPLTASTVAWACEQLGTSVEDLIEQGRAKAKCPGWCEQHLAGVDAGIVHQRRVVFGDASVMIEETTDAPEGCTDPAGPVVTDCDFHWISEDTIRNYARVLTLAADIIGVPEVTQ